MVTRTLCGPPAYVKNNPTTFADLDGHADPSKQEVIRQINSLADAYKVPRETMRAVVRTESNFDVHAKNENKNKKGKVTSTDYGLFQINSKLIGSKVTGSNGKKFTITQSIKTDWKVNANAGAALVSQAYKTAVKEQTPGNEEDRAQQTYSQYNAGPGKRDRYLKTDKNGNFADKRDEHFLDNYYSEQKRTDDK